MTGEQHPDSGGHVLPDDGHELPDHAAANRAYWNAVAADWVESGDALVLDHLIVAGPDLEEIVTLVRARTGVGAVVGGRHLGHGTHNALAGLGSGRYLELLAPDGTQDGGAFSETIAHLRTSALHTWCVRGGDAASFARRVRAAGARPRRVPMSRLRADGSELAWELVFVEDHPFGTLVPFFVDWLGASHPAPSLPQGLELDRLELRHGEAEALRAFLERLGGVPAPAAVVSGDASGDVSGGARIAATIRSGVTIWTPSGAPHGAA